MRSEARGRRHSFPLIAALLVLVLGAGCAGYKVGPTNGQQAGARSVEITPFINDTLEPRLTEAVTSAMRKRVQQDGTYRLETRGAGDVVVTGTITRFERSELSFLPSDVITVRDYYLALWARVVAIDQTTGKTNLNALVAGRTTIRVGSDLSSAERQAVPLMAADLARNATALLVDGTW